jgi:hypothetical protein
MATGYQTTGVTISAVRYPPCRCGRPYTHHAPEGCQGYRPLVPVEDLGTRGYVPRLSLRGWRRIVCVALWGIERRLQRWRENMDEHGRYD